MPVILVKQNTVKLRSKDTRLIRIPRYYGQFSLSLGRKPLLSTATTPLCFWFFRCRVDVLQS